MDNSDPKANQHIDAAIVDLFLKCLHGEATPEELVKYRAELRNPHSRLRDWLEDIEMYAVEISERRPFHTEAGDAILDLAVARRDRDDVVAFLHRKRSEGKINEEQLSYLLSEGVLRSAEGQPATSEDYRQSAKQMLESAVKVQPSLASEAAVFIKVRGQGR